MGGRPCCAESRDLLLGVQGDKKKETITVRGGNPMIDTITYNVPAMKLQTDKDEIVT